jgi:dUTP pyrophosphatase
MCIKNKKKERMFCQVKKLSSTSILPTQGYPQSAGYDLYSNEEVSISPHSRKIVHTGIAIQIPSLEDSFFRVYGSIRSRSGLSAKNGLETGAGVIDMNYTGEIKVILHNHSDEVFHVEKGSRIAQLVFEVHVCPQWKEVTHFQLNQLNNTSRGENGFGSSGLL